MVKAAASGEERMILETLREVVDPEIPVLNIVEMGIVRQVEKIGDSVRVTITPTYSGCPAMQMIRDQILAALSSQGFGVVEIRQVYAPAWTTDWMTGEAKRKLKDYGVAPPRWTDGTELVPLEIETEPVPCPHCGSLDTELRSSFGSTACKEFHFCSHCRQPFEAFKTI